MKAMSVISLLAIAVLCASAVAQELDAQYWYETGLELSTNQSYEEAVQALDKAIEIEPQNATLWLAKGQVLHAVSYDLHGQERIEIDEDAIKAYEMAIQIDPNYTDAWISKGFIFLQTAILNGTSEADLDKLDEALKSFDRAIEINPKDANAWQGRGSVLLREERYEEAVESYDRALENDPTNIGASQGKGLALSKMEMNNESAEAYDGSLEALDRDIEDANSAQNLSQAWLSKGFVLQEQDKYEEAVRALDNSTNANPENEMAWKVKGFMLANWMGRYQEGLASLDRALGLKPTADVWEIKGRVFNELGRYDDAINASEMALSLDRNLTRTWLVEGRALLGLGRYQEAIDAYSYAENAYDEQLFAGRGFALIGLNRSDEASEAFNKSLNACQKALGDDNKSAYAWFWKGEALRGLGSYQDALNAYNRSLDSGPDNAISSWRGKGCALKALGLDSQADAAFAKAKDLGYQG
jgi:tetratricopeptide (TPR) repeat protein